MRIGATYDRNLILSQHPPDCRASQFLIVALHTACAKAGIEGFRVHDWRHDWAARMVMAGVDLYTLMRLGGWSSLQMVQRYASVSADHLREAMARLG